MGAFRYNLIPLPLAGFKKAFGLTCEDKGDFPFYYAQRQYFNTERLGLPPISFYHPEGKSPEKKEEFLKWYHSHPSDYVFRFNDELINYCRQDTVILLLGLLAFRDAMITATGYCVLTHSPTIVSFTSLVLRCDHLPPKTLTNTPENGYNFRRQQSE